MSFLNATGVPNMPTGVGNPNAKIMIVGDCPDVHSIKANKPFSGPRETILEGCLHQAELTKSEVYITNFIKDDTRLEKYWKGVTNRKKLIANVDAYKEVLFKEIEDVNPVVIVTIDELPTYILTGRTTLAGKDSIRGYPILSDGRIIIPTWPPGKMIWSNYIWRYYLSSDLQKARKLSKNPELAFNPKIEVTIPNSFIEAKGYLNYVCNFSKLSVDIEVENFEVSAIGFATSNIKTFSIPFDMRWTIEEEVALWNMVANILQDDSIEKIGQNFIFDMHFLMYKMGIVTKGKILDTMMAHSILYPDFLKGLGFLGSIHTMQSPWKGMVKFKDIKKES